MNIEKDLDEILFNDGYINTEVVKKELINYINENFTPKNIKKNKTQALQEISLYVETWSDEFINIFPSGYSGTKLIRGDKKDCIKKISEIIYEYNFTKEQILEATKNYVKSLDGNYKYILAATYFIKHKDKGSELAAYVQQLTDIDYIKKKEKEKIIEKDFFV